MSLVAGIPVLLLGIVAVVTGWRLWRRATRHRVPLVLLHGAAAIALYAVLFPPGDGTGSATLVVIAPGATPAQVSALDPDARVVALPGAQATPGATPVPDLATALRLHPEAGSVRVLGVGLPARDRDAIGTRSVAFEPVPMPPGITTAELPAAVVAGNRWQVRGRVQAPAGARLDWRDPGDVLLASVVPGADGAYAFDAPAKVGGQDLFRLSLVDATNRVLDELPVPLVATAPGAVRALLLAGGPSPELKYLRRWARDAGVTLDARLDLAPGVAIRSGEAALDAAALAAWDLVIVDARAWAGLRAAERRALSRAVEEGLGLLLRLDGVPPEAVAADWRALGFDIRASEAPRAVALAPPQALDPALGALSRIAVEVRTEGAPALLLDDAGRPLAQWRVQGQGRVGAWWLEDSFRLVLSGARDRHGTLWARVFATLARARAALSPTLPAWPRVGERARFCALPTNARIERAGAAPVLLLVDPASGPDACAAFWPEHPGWHQLRAGDRTFPFHVLAPDQGRALAAAADAQATRMLSTPPVPQAAPVASARAWLAALWLLLSAAGWWLERRTVASKR